MAGAGAGREVRLLERVWAALTGTEIEDGGPEEEEEEEEKMLEKRKLLEEKGMELMRKLLKEKEREAARKDTESESGYPPGFRIGFKKWIFIFFLYRDIGNAQRAPPKSQ